MIIKLAFAFGAGFISFLTPCVLPIIPGYISYITGKNLSEIQKDRTIVLYKTILFSLQMLGILNFQFLNQEKRINTKGYKDNYIFPFVVGAAFAFGWTPCIGPVLGSILALSATEASISKGILLLSFYSLGLAIPFILSGYYMNNFLISKKGFGKYYNRITKTGGAILLITGILIATNQIQVISYYILTTFPFLTSLG